MLCNSILLFLSAFPLFTVTLVTRLLFLTISIRSIVQHFRNSQVNLRLSLFIYSWNLGIHGQGNLEEAFSSSDPVALDIWFTIISSGSRRRLKAAMRPEEYIRIHMCVRVCDAQVSRCSLEKVEGKQRLEGKMQSRIIIEIDKSNCDN